MSQVVILAIGKIGGGDINHRSYSARRSISAHPHRLRESRGTVPTNCGSCLVADNKITGEPEIKAPEIEGLGDSDTASYGKPSFNHSYTCKKTRWGGEKDNIFLRERTGPLPQPSDPNRFRAPHVLPLSEIENFGLPRDYLNINRRSRQDLSRPRSSCCAFEACAGDTPGSGAGRSRGR